MPYELKLEKFSGPLEKLLELIEERKLEISEISLAEVTEDFLRYLKKISGSGADLRVIADFIAVASRLVLIKSKTILPDLALTEEEAAGMKDLEKRLKLYQDLKPALKILARLWKTNNKEFSRPFLMLRGLGADGKSGFFYPGGNLQIDTVFDGIKGVFDSLGDFSPDTETIREKIASVEEKMKEIVERLARAGESSFNALSGRKSRSEIIAVFLAILHLAREQLIFLEQYEKFSDIIIRRQAMRDKRQDDG